MFEYFKMENKIKRQYNKLIKEIEKSKKQGYKGHKVNRGVYYPIIYDMLKEKGYKVEYHYVPGNLLKILIGNNVESYYVISTDKINKEE